MDITPLLMVFIISLAVIYTVRQVSVVLKKKFLRLLTTPLITYLITAIAITAVLKNPADLKWIIVAALGLSLIADSVLMIENPYLFTEGLVFFLGTHILYITAFSRGYRFMTADILSGAVLLALLIFFVYRYYRAGKLGKMLVPVIVYVTALSLVVYFSVNGALRDWNWSTALRMCGAILFYISDAIIGWTEFVKYYRFTTLYVWLFYAPGQLLIALSLLY